MLEDIMNNKVDIDQIRIESAREKNISVEMLRLDLIHPLVPGNKLFKLYYFIVEALQSPHKKILTFGGAYSNHLAATAAVCKENNLQCTGIVNGTKPPKLSHTLLFCQQMGMQLEFISREAYKKRNEPADMESNDFAETGLIVIPEGGFSRKGVDGASLISNYYKHLDYTHICCATGSGATLAGLIRASRHGQQIMGFSVVKNRDDFDLKMKAFNDPLKLQNYALVQDYNFGGFAKKTPALIDYMNQFYNDHCIPLDFVYTAKMMFGVNDLLEKNYFPEHAKILCIHTGGLQGNLSLPPGTLSF